MVVWKKYINMLPEKKETTKVKNENNINCVDQRLLCMFVCTMQ